MSGELRVNHLPRAEQVLDALEIARVGSRLGGVHGKAGEAAFLGALDLAVPVGALHETHAHAPAGLARELRNPAEHQRGAPSVGLHRESQAIPLTGALI